MISSPSPVPVRPPGPSRRPAEPSAHPPRAEEVEAAELLGELHGFIHHALLDIVPAQLDEAGQREILAQRMSLETVVGQNAPQIRMIGKPYAVEIVGLALEPAGRAVDPRSRRHRRRLVRHELHADALVVLDAEQIVDHVEALLALRPVDTADVDQLREQALGIVAQIGQQRDHLVRRGVEHQLAKTSFGLRDHTHLRLDDVVAEFLESLAHQRTSVPVRRTFFWSWSTP
jgi:hypothetical protein